MNKTFIKTQNVKNFIGLVENLQNKPKNIPKMGLVYGEPGLGKSQTALWLACKYDAIYLRATKLMTGRWLLEELVKELDEIPRFLTSDNFNLVVKKLKPTIIIMIDALATSNKEYLNNCIEINNTGIIPGSAIKDSKKIDSTTFDIPVIAIGVPLVLDIDKYLYTSPNIREIVNEISNVISKSLNNLFF